MKKLALLLTILALVLATVPVSADSVTGFQYHGYLEDGNGPVTGTCDFEFELYDALTAGTQIGSTLASDTVAVTDGWFWITLDFGDVYDGTALWLETAVTCDANPLQTLSPRQELGATPYALYSKTAPWSGLTGVPAGFADGVDNTASFTIGQGLALDGVTLAVDFAVAQVRVTGSCASGSFMQSINADGSVNCAADEMGPTYTIGAGLQQTSTTISVDYSTTQARIASACQTGYVMTGVNASGVPTCTVDVGGTSYTATDGVTLAGTTFSADTAYMQRRVLGACDAGYKMTGINATGVPTCTVDIDTNTTYSAASGVTLTGTVFSADTTYVQARISNTCAAGSFITGVNASGVATCTAAVTLTHGLNDTTYHTGAPLTVANGGTGTSTTQASGAIWITGATGAVATSNLYFDSANGYLGIGTRYPSWEVHVAAAKNGSAGNVLLNSSTGSAALEYFILGQVASGGKYGGFYHFNDNYTASAAWDEPKSTGFISSDVNGMNFISFGNTTAGDMCFYVGGGAASNKTLTMATDKKVTAEGAIVAKSTVQATGYKIGNTSGTLTATGVTTSLTVLYDARVNSDNYVRYCSYVTMTITGGIITAVSSPTAFSECPAYVP